MRPRPAVPAQLHRKTNLLATGDGARALPSGPVAPGGQNWVVSGFDDIAVMGKAIEQMVAPQLKQWESEGRYLTTVLFQHKVFCKDCGNPAAPPDRTLLLLHGFPESSFSFHKVVEGLAKLFDRVVLFDFPGYGLSDKPLANYTYSLFEQADVALQVWKERGVTGGHVLSHDMGDSVHTELVARHVSGRLPAWLSAGLQSVTFTRERAGGVASV